MKNVLLISDYKYPGGYHVIANGLASRLAAHDVDVTLLGRGWDGSEHSYPFRIIPTRTEYLPLHVKSLARELNSDWVLLMMDIPRIVSIFDNILVHEPEFAKAHRCAALFPVESEPVTYPRWEAGLHRFAVRFTFTEFGVRQCAAAGISAHRLPVGVDPSWYAPAREEQVFEVPRPYILMVAENQIRKNQPAAYLMAKMAGRLLVLVTEPANPDGWDLKHLRKQCGLEPEQVMVLNKSLVSKEQLKYLYRNAESLVLPSLAEGIGLPLYEAQAQGCPVVATDCCGIPEAIRSENSLIKVQAVTPYPWGNTVHHWPDVIHGTELLKLAADKPRTNIDFPSWDLAGETLYRMLNIFEEVSESVKA